MLTKKFISGIVALLSLSSITIIGCADAESISDAEDQPEAVGQGASAFTIACDPTAITADATQSTQPGNCDNVRNISSGDSYTELLCTPYVVEYTYKPTEIAAGWDHDPWSQAECAAMRASATLYTFNGTSWTTNGTATYHGEWCSGGFCQSSCGAVLDAGSVVPQPGNGTKWRVAAKAYAKNCTSTSCYNDYKRVAVTNFAECVIY